LKPKKLKSLKCEKSNTHVDVRKSGINKYLIRELKNKIPKRCFKWCQNASFRVLYFKCFLAVPNPQTSF